MAVIPFFNGGLHGWVASSTGTRRNGSPSATKLVVTAFCKSRASSTAMCRQSTLLSSKLASARCRLRRFQSQ